MRQLLATLLLAAGPLSAQPQAAWELYHAPGADAAELTRRVQPLLPPGVPLQLHELAPQFTTRQEAELHARAMAAGVSALPCLALRDAEGVYATLPLSGLSPERIEQARRMANAPERKPAAHRRILAAHLYLLRYMLSICPDSSEQDRIINRLQQHMEAPDTPDDLRQLIGLHGVYPALMQQYASEYKGGHTPRTEAKLLAAIRTLEYVRDTDPRSTLGRSAYDEREKLRAARLKSRQYE